MPESPARPSGEANDVHVTTFVPKGNCVTLEQGTFDEDFMLLNGTQHAFRWHRCCSQTTELVLEDVSVVVQGEFPYDDSGFTRVVMCADVPQPEMMGGDMRPAPCACLDGDIVCSLCPGSSCSAPLQAQQDQEC